MTREKPSAETIENSQDADVRETPGPRGPTTDPDLVRDWLSQTVDWSVSAEPQLDDVSRHNQLKQAIASTQARTYTVLGEVARGSGGRILKAYDARLGRTVALKELLQSGSESADRFLQEALITSHLQHPAIVPIYDAGLSSTGIPFYAMKLVSGRSLEKVIQESGTVEERIARLPNLIAVAEAIAYAHSEGIIHRDLKPANVLVGAFGETVVVDWGLAQRVQQSAPDSSVGVDSEKVIVGTPSYMAPEQANGAAADQRTDVYALGAMLYQLLTGNPPHLGDSPLEVIKQVAAGVRPERVEDQEPRVPRDLAAIVHKAMALAPEQRYQTASEFAVDLTRFATGQLVSARHYSPWTRTRRWVKRHQAPVSVAAVLLSILITTIAVSFKKIVRERNEADRQKSQAVIARKEAETRTNELIVLEARNSLERDPTTTIAWLKTYPLIATGWGAIRTIAARALDEGIARRVLRGNRSYVNAVVFLPDRRIASAGFDGTIRIWQVDTGAVSLLEGHTKPVWHLALSANGLMLASASFDKTVRLWNLETGEQQVLAGHTAYVRHVSFSPDGQVLASASEDASIRLWDVKTGALIGVLPGHSSIVWDVEFSPDGRYIVSASRDKTVRLWNRATGQHKVLAKHDAPVNTAVFSPDGRSVLSSGDDGVSILVDLPRNKHLIFRGHTAAVRSAVFSPDGKSIASASEDRTVQVWDLDGHVLQILRGHLDELRSISFSSDGEWLASGGKDNTTRLWNLKTGEKHELRGHTALVSMVAFSAEGQIASASWDRTLRIWDIPKTGAILRTASPACQLKSMVNGPQITPRDTCPTLWNLRWSPGGRNVAVIGDRPIVWLWEVDTQKVIELRGHERPIYRAAFSPTGNLLASAGADHTVRIWHLDSGTNQLFAGHIKPVRSLVFSSDGRTVISGGMDHTVRIWDVASGASQELTDLQDDIEEVAISHDNKLIAAAGLGSEVHVWEPRNGSHRVIAIRGARPYSLRFSQQDRYLAATAKEVNIWDLQTGTVSLMNGHPLGTIGVEFISDDQLVSAGLDTRIILWNLRTNARKVLEGHEQQVTSISLSADHSRLASSSWDGTVRLWDLATGESRALKGHRGHVNFVAFSPDGKQLASSGEDGTTRLWPDPLPLSPPELRKWMDDVTDFTLPSSGNGPDSVP